MLISRLSDVTLYYPRRMSELRHMDARQEWAHSRAISQNASDFISISDRLSRCMILTASWRKWGLSSCFWRWDSPLDRFDPEYFRMFKSKHGHASWNLINHFFASIISSSLKVNFVLRMTWSSGRQVSLPQSSLQISKSRRLAFSPSRSFAAMIWLPSFPT